MTKKNKKEESCCDCEKIGKIVDQISKGVKAKAKKAENYAKKNPKEAKKVAFGIGAFLLAILALFIGKKRKNKDIDIDL